MTKNFTLHLLRLTNCPILQQLQLEEALLRADQRNWCILNTGSSPAIVMGISGKPELLINPAKLKEAPVPVIRRFSGGGTVFVDENTCFVTFICNSAESNVACYPDKVMQWSGQLYQDVFPSLEFGLRENDYVFNNRKFGGNAQYLSKQRWLHHSSLLWDFTPSNMDYLLLPPKMPAYREKRGHTEFLCRLRDLHTEKGQLHKNIVNALEQRFRLEEVTLDEIQEIVKRPHRRATSIVVTVQSEISSSAILKK